MKIGYARMSAKDQGLALRVDAMKESGAERIHTEIASGAKAEWPVLAKLLNIFYTGDVLIIWKLDSLGRSLCWRPAFLSDAIDSF